MYGLIAVILDDEGGHSRYAFEIHSYAVVPGKRSQKTSWLLTLLLYFACYELCETIYVLWDVALLKTRVSCALAVIFAFCEN